MMPPRVPRYNVTRTCHRLPSRVGCRQHGTSRVGCTPAQGGPARKSVSSAHSSVALVVLRRHMHFFSKDSSFGFSKLSPARCGAGSTFGGESKVRPQPADKLSAQMNASMGIARAPDVPWCAPSDPAPSTRAWAFSRQGSSPASMRAWALPAVAGAKVHASMGIARQAST